MIGSALLTLYRSLTRHRLYAVLNIGGLALGIAVFLVLFLFVQFETGFDRVLPGWDKTWVVQRSLQFPGNPTVSIPSRLEMLPQMQADYPGTTGTRMVSDDVAVQIGAQASPEHMAQVDRNFFAVFPYYVIAGDPLKSLSTPAGAVITARIARTYFGSGSPIGRTLTAIVDGKPRAYRVGALIEDMPDNITFKHDIFVRLKTDDPTLDRSARGLTTFLRFPDAGTASARVAQFPAFVARHPDPSFDRDTAKLVTEKLQPLASIHLAEARDRMIVAVLGAVGLLTLAIATVNYINLATARAGLRAREVAIRKVVGATRRSLIVQFLAEALASVAVAGLIGLALTEVALPFVNAAGGTSLRIAYLGAGSILPPLVAMIVVLGMIAGFYPAFVLSRFQPAAVLASIRAPGGGRGGARLRRALVVMQFAIAIALMIGTTVLVAQTWHLQSSDIGFRRGGLIVVPSFADHALDAAQRHDVVAAASQISRVSAVTRSAIAPVGGSFGIAPMHRAGSTGSDPMIVTGDVAPRFFETYRARLLAGRFFDASRYARDLAAGSDADGGASSASNIILNRRAAMMIGFNSAAAAIGQTVMLDKKDAATIIGVIDDMRFKSPREPVEAMAYFERDRDLGAPVLALRYDGQDPRPVLAALGQAWQHIAATVPLRAMTVDQQLYDVFYKDDAQRSRLFTIGAVLAVLIGCLGLYGLASFDTARRVREIGIRKTLGASKHDIMRLLIGQFLRPVLLANLIAWPLAYFAMRKWLAGFDDRIALSPLFFIGASLAAVLIACLTIFAQTWRVARAEPARALRYE